jgi:hypothetical protein
MNGSRTKKNPVKGSVTINQYHWRRKKFCGRKKVRQVELKKSNFSRESFEEQMEVSVLKIKDRELQRMD